MKTWKQGIIGILAIIALAFAFIACDNDNGDTHTHEWEWVVTTPVTYDTDGLETETCKTCKATNGTRTIAKYKTEQQVQIGGGTTVVNITAEYNRTDNTSLEKIHNAVDWFNLRFNEGSSTHQDTITNLLNGAGSYKIIVDYDSNFDGFVPANTQTLKVSKAWLDTITITDPNSPVDPNITVRFNGNTLRTALNTMLDYTE
jgi:uncharacterized surface protein with fasciclin (FAS1) repeats